MANTKLNADGYGITVWWALPNAFANVKAPTVAELNATRNVTTSMAWDQFSFGNQASAQNSDPSFADVGNTQTRGFAAFGGSISFFYPYDYTNTSNDLVTTFAAIATPLTLGYVLVRVDGQKTTASVVDNTKGAVDGDFVEIYKVLSDGYADSIVGQNSFKYSIKFQPQGELYTNAFVSASPMVVTTPVAIGTVNYVSAGKGKTPLSSFVTGRQLSLSTGFWSGYPGRFIWSSSAPLVASVDANGVVTAQSAGTANITATDKNTGTASTALAITTT